MIKTRAAIEPFVFRNALAQIRAAAAAKNEAVSAATRAESERKRSVQ
jgi:hypothetical protein